MLNEQTLYFGLPISLSEDVKLYQPKLREILEANMTFEEILEPFVTLDKGHFEGDKENNLVDFDYFFVQILLEYINVLQSQEELNLLDWLQSEKSNSLVIKRLVKILKLLFRTNDVQIHISEEITNKLGSNYILIEKSYKIDRETYPILKNIICEIFDTEIKIEKKQEVSKEESELDKIFAERKAEYEKTHGKKKEKNKENITIFKLINYIIHNKYSQYNYDSIQELTIYQIKNTFKYYQNQESYDVDIRYRTSGQFKIKNDSEHWFFDKS